MTTLIGHPLPQSNELLDEDEAAAFLNFKPRALQAWRYQGRGPKFVKISARAVRYRMEDLIAFIESKLRTSTSQK